MRKLNLWWIPAVFFAMCCVLNLIGCAIDDNLERIIKPSLMPLLSLTTFIYLLESFPPSSAAEGGTSPAPWGAALLLLGQLFGFAGDTMLLGKGFSYFAGGIGGFFGLKGRNPFRNLIRIHKLFTL